MLKRNTGRVQNVVMAVMRMIKGIVMAILALETFSDVRTGTVSGVRIIIFGLIGIVLNAVLRYQSIISIAGGLIVGGVILLYSVVTKGGIGKGDGLMFVCLGIYLGLSVNLQLLFYSLIVAAVTGGIYSLVKKKGLKSQIPFMPCILVTYLIILVMEELI